MFFLVSLLAYTCLTMVLYLSCSLLVELTIVPSTSVSGGELFHQSAEEAYESGVHAVRSPEGHKTLWREYIYYMRAKVAGGSREDFQRFLDCVHRCLMDVEFTSTSGSGPCGPQPQASASSAGSCGSFTDYSFHNEV